jgi:hypothetical protein
MIYAIDNAIEKIARIKLQHLTNQLKNHRKLVF